MHRERETKAPKEVRSLPHVQCEPSSEVKVPTGTDRRLLAMASDGGTSIGGPSGDGHGRKVQQKGQQQTNSRRSNQAFDLTFLASLKHLS